jgi:hypothetical protein
VQGKGRGQKKLYSVCGTGNSSARRVPALGKIQRERARARQQVHTRTCTRKYVVVISNIIDKYPSTTVAEDNKRQTLASTSIHTHAHAHTTCTHTQHIVTLSTQSPALHHSCTQHRVPTKKGGLLRKSRGNWRRGESGSVGACVRAEAN